jgi:hypothetical protein
MLPQLAGFNSAPRDARVKVYQVFGHGLMS